MFEQKFGYYMRFAREAEKMAGDCSGDLRKGWLRLAMQWRDLASHASIVAPQRS